jgi:ribosome-associated heat shock protein Hsp15
MDDKLRTDKYLWDIRLFKTRALATRACGQGKVRLAGKAVKAAKPVAVGDTYSVRTGGRERLVKVRALPSRRVSAAEAQDYYEDLTPVTPSPVKQAAAFYPTGRLPGSGRPTKKQRRDLDDFMDRD